MLKLITTEEVESLEDYFNPWWQENRYIWNDTMYPAKTAIKEFLANQLGYTYYDYKVGKPNGFKQ